MALIQSNRIYGLYIGGIDVMKETVFSQAYNLTIRQEALIIEPPMNISFSFVKYRNNSKRDSNGVINVFNLSDETIKKLEGSRGLNVTLYCGYDSAPSYNNENTIVDCIVRGNIISCKTRQDREQRITSLHIHEAFISLNDVKISNSIPEGKTIGDVIKSLINDINVENKLNNRTEISIKEFNGENHKITLLYGYPLRGTPKQCLDDIARAYNIEWSIDNNVLYIDDAASHKRTTTVDTYVYSKDTGLIEAFIEDRVVNLPLKTPRQVVTDSGRKTTIKTEKVKRIFVRFRALLNPYLKCGDLVQFELTRDSVSLSSDKYFIINSIKYDGEYRGKDWYIECEADEVEVIKTLVGI